MVAKVQTILITLILLAVCVRVMWWSIEPALPALLVGLLLLIIYQMIFRRKW